MYSPCFLKKNSIKKNSSAPIDCPVDNLKRMSIKVACQKHARRFAQVSLNKSTKRCQHASQQPATLLNLKDGQELHSAVYRTQLSRDGRDGSRLTSETKQKRVTRGCCGCLQLRSRSWLCVSSFFLLHFLVRLPKLLILRSWRGAATDSGDEINDLCLPLRQWLFLRFFFWFYSPAYTRATIDFYFSYTTPVFLPNPVIYAYRRLGRPIWPALKIQQSSNEAIHHTTFRCDSLYSRDPSIFSSSNNKLQGEDLIHQQAIETGWADWTEIPYSFTSSTLSDWPIPLLNR